MSAAPRSWRKHWRTRDPPQAAPTPRDDVMHRLRSCEGKRKYQAYSTAARIAADISQRQNEELHGYACEFCGMFHVGHVPRRD